MTPFRRLRLRLRLLIHHAPRCTAIASVHAAVAAVRVRYTQSYATRLYDCARPAWFTCVDCSGPRRIMQPPAGCHAAPGWWHNTFADYLHTGKRLADFSRRNCAAPASSLRPAQIHGTDSGRSSGCAPPLPDRGMRSLGSGVFRRRTQPGRKLASPLGPLLMISPQRLRHRRFLTRLPSRQ